MKSRWTKRLDELLLSYAQRGKSYAEMAEAVRRATRGRFQPHPTTCYRRLGRIASAEERRALEGKGKLRPVADVSTRVDAEEELERIPPRVRAPLRGGAPPPVTVLALPAADVDRAGLEQVLEELLCATPPGWTWRLLSPEESRGDALACARHQAALRGDTLELVEDLPGQHPVVLRRRPGEKVAGRLLVLVVVRFERV